MADQATSQYPTQTERHRASGATGALLFWGWCSHSTSPIDVVINEISVSGRHELRYAEVMAGPSALASGRNGIVQVGQPTGALPPRSERGTPLDKEFQGANLCSSLYFKSTRQSHEAALGWCYCGVRLRGSEIKYVHDRAPDVFLPRKHYQVIASVRRWSQRCEALGHIFSLGAKRSLPG